MDPGRAALLGAVHGVAELLPVSSSGHLTLVPWLLGWEALEVDASARKTFEVALHAGSALALAIVEREAMRGLLREGRGAVVLIVLATAPAGAAGLALERPVEQRLGTPQGIAAGLIAGGIAMALGERRPQERPLADANARDALWLGIAQALALAPGVSRSGATLAAARALRFERAAAAELSRRLAFPVIAGACALKALRLLQGARSPQRSALAAGATAAFASTFAVGCITRARGQGLALRTFAAYRVALGTAVLATHAARRSAESRTMGT